MRSIKARIENLSAQLQLRKRSIREIPYEDLDPLSQAMMDLVYELEALDTVEKKAAYCEKADLDLDGLERFVRSITIDYV